jgi:hypothetical protein
VPEPVRERLVDALGSGAAVSGAHANVRAASEQAFVDALGAGLTIAAIATALAALAAWLMIDPTRPQHEAVAAPEPEAAMV